MKRPGTLRVPIVGVLALAVGALLAINLWQEEPMLTGKTQPAPGATREQLIAAGKLRVFFGHQSVGWNIISGIQEEYEAAGLTPPPFIETSSPPEQSGPFFAHAPIGANGDPASKIRAFEANLRSGLGEQVQVALMKLCYVDFSADTDVNALFADYASSMSRLEREYPHVEFLYSTAPLTTVDRGLRAHLKALLGRDSQDEALNAVREQYNALVRAKYASTGRLFDLAAIESTNATGERVEGIAGGHRSYELYAPYASDQGHLNAVGSGLAASALVSLIAATATTS